MIMEWCKSNKGHDVILLSDDNYMSFGKDGEIKWVHLSYLDPTGIRRGQLLPVTLNKIKREYSSVIGKKNLSKLRGLIQQRLDGEKLPRNKFCEVGEIINIEQRKETAKKNK